MCFLIQERMGPVEHLARGTPTDRHIEVELVKTGHAWTQSRLHVGNRRKSPRDRINDASRWLRDPWKKAGKDGSHLLSSRGQTDTLRTDMLYSHYIDCTMNTELWLKEDPSETTMHERVNLCQGVIVVGPDAFERRPLARHPDGFSALHAARK